MRLIDDLLARAGFTWRLLLKELSAFGIVGAVCFAIDLGLFQALYAHAGVGAVTSKLLSTLVSTTAAYIGHRYWSFSHRARTGLRREYTLFVVVNGVTLLIGLLLVAAVRYGFDQESAVVLQATNIVSIGLGTVIRYACYRQFVFPSHETVAERAAESAGASGITESPEAPETAHAGQLSRTAEG